MPITGTRISIPTTAQNFLPLFFFATAITPVQIAIVNMHLYLLFILRSFVFLFSTFHLLLPAAHCSCFYLLLCFYPFVFNAFSFHFPLSTFHLLLPAAHCSCFYLLLCFYPFVFNAFSFHFPLSTFHFPLSTYYCLLSLFLLFFFSFLLSFCF